MGNRFPGKEGNVCECSVPLPPESIAMAQLAEQASQCDVPEELEIPAALTGTYLGLAGPKEPFQASASCG